MFCNINWMFSKQLLNKMWLLFIRLIKLRLRILQRNGCKQFRNLKMRKLNFTTLIMNYRHLFLNNKN